MSASSYLLLLFAFPVLHRRRFHLSNRLFDVIQVFFRATPCSSPTTYVDNRLPTTSSLFPSNDFVQSSIVANPSEHDSPLSLHCFPYSNGTQLVDWVYKMTRYTHSMYPLWVIWTEILLLHRSKTKYDAMCTQFTHLLGRNGTRSLSIRSVAHGVSLSYISNIYFVLLHTQSSRATSSSTLVGLERGGNDRDGLFEFYVLSTRWLGLHNPSHRDSLLLLVPTTWACILRHSPNDNKLWFSFTDVFWPPLCRVGWICSIASNHRNSSKSFRFANMGLVVPTYRCL